MSTQDSARESGGISIEDFLGLKIREFFDWCYQEGSKAGFLLEDVQARLPKYYEAIMGEIWKMEPEFKAGSYKGIEDRLPPAKKLFARAIERLKELKRTQT